MKGFCIVLFCAFAAAQARSFAPVEDTPTQPWLVHLRVARPNAGGLLSSCVGTLYNQQWVLTSASCILNARYVWIRYDAQNVFRPGFVTETSLVNLHPEYNAMTGENDIGLVNINRNITFSDTIKPISLAESNEAAPSSGIVCGYGEKDDQPGEDLQCVEVTLSGTNGLLVAHSEGQASRYDFGAALVSDDKVHGVLVRVGDEHSSGAFLSTSEYVSWIEEVAGKQVPQYDAVSVADENVLVAEPILVASIDY